MDRHVIIPVTSGVCVCVCVCVHEGHLKSSWFHLITPSRNFVEVRDCLFFEVPPLKSDALLTTLHPLLENVLQIVCRTLQEEPRGFLCMTGKTHKSHGARSELYDGKGSESGSVEPH
jgi:hypothetical protein